MVRDDDSISGHLFIMFVSACDPRQRTHPIGISIFHTGSILQHPDPWKMDTFILVHSSQTEAPGADKNQAKMPCAGRSF